MKTLIAVLPFFFFSCTTGNESVPPVGTAVFAVTEADTERAWTEIQSIYAREIDSYLSGLEPADQEKILADFVAMNEDPHELRIRWTTVGTPKYILAPAFRVTGSDLGLTGPASTDSVSTSFLERFSALWRTSPTTLSEAAVSHLSFNDAVCSDVTAIEYRQRYNGLPVVDATLRVLLRTSDNSIAGVVGSFSPIEAYQPQPRSLKPRQERSCSSKTMKQPARHGLSSGPATCPAIQEIPGLRGSFRSRISGDGFFGWCGLMLRTVQSSHLET